MITMQKKGLSIMTIRGLGASVPTSGTGTVTTTAQPDIFAWLGENLFKPAVQTASSVLTASGQSVVSDSEAKRLLAQAEYQATLNAGTSAEAQAKAIENITKAVMVVAVVGAGVFAVIKLRKRSK